MSEKYSLVTQFKGYINKADVTNVSSEYLVYPSQNVLINDAEKVATRAGYSLVGAANSATTPILSSFDWTTSTGTEINLRKYDTTLEYYYSSSWRTLDTANLFSSTANLNFRTWWSASEVKDLLLFVDGTTNLHMWSGGITTYASSTINTITKQGTNTWAQDRFLLANVAGANVRAVKIGSITYSYTGGEGTTTLTGVTPDPTVNGHVAGDIAVQTITTVPTIPGGGGTTFSADIIEVNRNQVYLADFAFRDVYVSKNTSFIDYTFSTPRLPGEGALITIDAPPVGFAVQEEDVYVSSNRNDWYKTSFTLSSDLTKEKLEIKKLKSGTGQGAYSQSSITQAKNSVIFFSNERVIDTLGRVENINTPQSLPLSDPIKAELLSYDLTVAPDSVYFRNQSLFTFPSEGKILIFDHARNIWQPPQVLPVRKFAIINGDLCGHSSATPETYKLFDGTNDNGAAMDAIAAFSYRNFGDAAAHKDFDEWYTEGYIASNTVLGLTLNVDYGGFTTIYTKDIEGDNSSILYGAAADSSLGKNPLGSNPLGTTTAAVDDLSKFRTVSNFKKRDFYEIQSVYGSNDIDFQWELLRQGPNIARSTIGTNEIQA